MADSKVTALTAIASVAGEDLVFIIDDPSGTPLDRKATITQILTYIKANTASTDLTDTANIAYINAANTFTEDQTITNTDDTVILRLFNNVPTPIDNDVIGLIQFQADTDLTSQQNFGQIRVETQDITDASASGIMHLRVMEDKAITSYIDLDGEAETVSLRPNDIEVVNISATEVDLSQDLDLNTQDITSAGTSIATAATTGFTFNQDIAINDVSNATTRITSQTDNSDWPTFRGFTSSDVGGFRLIGLCDPTDDLASPNPLILLDARQDDDTPIVNRDLLTVRNQGTDLINVGVNGTIFMSELAAADTDRTAWGQIWVKNDTPNTLMFTRDDGTDVDLTTGAEVTTWTAAHDAAGFQFNLDGSTMSIIGDITTANNMQFTVPSGDVYDFDVTGTGTVLSASGSGVEVLDGLQFSVGTAEAGKTVTVNIPDDTQNEGLTIKNADGFIELRNGTGTANQFQPNMRFRANGNGQFPQIISEILTADDTGTAPVFRINVRDNALNPISTRPLFAVTNDAVSRLEVASDGQLTINSGTTNSDITLGGANTLADNAVIADINFNANTDDVGEAAFARISAIMESDAATDNEGSLGFYSMHNDVEYLFYDYNLTTIAVHTWKNIGTTLMTLNNNGLTIASSRNFSVETGQNIAFDGLLSGATQTISGDADGLTYTVPSADTHDFVVNATTVLSLGENGSTVDAGSGSLSVTGSAFPAFL